MRASALQTCFHEKLSKYLVSQQDKSQVPTSQSMFNHTDIHQSTFHLPLLVECPCNCLPTNTTEQIEGDCIFCCGGGDALHHYLRCDHLWTLLVSCARLDKSWLTATPAQRLGFVEPTTTSLLLITVAFWVYHGMKARRVAGLAPVSLVLNAHGLLI